MFDEKIKPTVIGSLKITDKETGEVLVQKRNAIHIGNMAYVMASSMAGLPLNVNSNGGAPFINWMAFGNGGSNSTTTLSYKSPRVSTVYDGLDMTASSARLYSKTYQQQTVNSVMWPGQTDPVNGGIIPNSTSKINFKVEMSHTDVEDYVNLTNPGVSIPQTDSSTDAESVAAFTFDEIGLVAGKTTANELIEEGSLLVTHVTFHPILLSANRTIIIDYTITIQLS